MFKEIKDFYKRYELIIWLIFIFAWLFIMAVETYKESKKEYHLSDRNKILTEMFKEDLKKEAKWK